MNHVVNFWLTIHSAGKVSMQEMCTTFVDKNVETAIVPFVSSKIYTHTMGMIDAMPVYMKTKKENSLEPLNFEMTQYI